jgi:thioredoxin-related protein
MRSKLSLLTISLFIFSVSIIGQIAKPEPAQKILDKAIQNAGKSNKSVFLIYHASWCSWCKRLEAAMTSEELSKIFEDHFVITHLDVLERGDKVETLENPGGKEIMKKMGGEKSGLPFYVFLDAKSNKLADSNIMAENQNIGYPGAKEEIDAFVSLLKKSSSNISEKELAAVTEYFVKNMPKPKQ